MKKSKKKGGTHTPATKYAHNPHYCMIRPDASGDHGDDVVSTGQS